MKRDFDLPPLSANPSALDNVVRLAYSDPEENLAQMADDRAGAAFDNLSDAAIKFIQSDRWYRECMDIVFSVIAWNAGNLDAQYDALRGAERLRDIWIEDTRDEFARYIREESEDGY